MITIRTAADLAEARLPSALHKAAQSISAGITSTYKASYRPDDDGYIVIVTSGDTDACLVGSLGWKWRDSMFEGVSLDSATGVWHAVILRDNQFTLSILALDEGLDAGIRQRLQLGV